MSSTFYGELNGRWYGILAHFIGEEFLTGRHGPCPICGGKDRFRFDDKDGEGSYYCTGCGPGYGMSLVMKAKGMDFKTAAGEIEKMIGLVKRRAPPKRINPRARLRRIATQSKHTRPGDPVFQYLVARGLSEIPPGLRTHLDLPYFEGTRVKGVYPAMLGVYSGPDGLGVTMQVTYIKDGTKAPVDSPKKTLPPVRSMEGGAVRLWPLMNGTLAVAEGVETACAAHEKFGVPAWATLSDNNLAKFQPPEEVETLLVVSDHDRSFAGQAAAFALAKRQKARGVKVQLVMPVKEDTDLLDEYVAS